MDPDSRHRPGTNLQFGWTDIISPALINEFKINADWHSQTTPLVSPAISLSRSLLLGVHLRLRISSPARPAAPFPRRTAEHFILG